MKKKILILGGTGMLGNAVTSFFLSNPDDYVTTFTYRKQQVANKIGSNSRYFDPLTQNSLEGFLAYDNYDYIINCIGVIKPFMKNSIEEAIYLNSLFPHKLARVCKNLNTKMIHISTDCVQTGAKGDYIETDLHDCLDDYGKSKSLGECVNDSMVIRTSIIGEEVHKNASLIAWAKSQAGKEVNGFTNHIWNGITTKQYAKVCHQIIQNGWFEIGLHHVFSNKVTKFHMLEEFNKKWNLELKINPVEAKEACDRSLSSIKPLIKKIDMPSFEKMIEEL